MTRISQLNFYNDNLPRFKLLQINDDVYSELLH